MRKREAESRRGGEVGRTRGREVEKVKAGEEEGGEEVR